MDARHRFLNTLNYKTRDRVPLIDIGFWGETIQAWHEQGLPESVDGNNADDYFGTDGFWRYFLSAESSDGTGLVNRAMIIPEGIRVGLAPLFERKVIEDLGDQEIFQMGDGIRVRRHKSMSSIPSHESHLLEEREDWEKFYKPRFDPDYPDRYPSDWGPWHQLAMDENREPALMLPAGSLYGWIRNWMGLEGVSYLVYDEPELFEEMVETITVCSCEVLRRTLERGGQFDTAFFWEDMSYNSGPLLSPDHFRKYLVPRYRRIVEVLNQYGVNHIIVDSDGKVDDLIPGWLDAGINCILPFEIGTTGADPLEYRKRFGKDLRIIGGFDKRILASTPEAIDAEIERLTPLVEEGGYIPTCDHKIPPDVPLANYHHYLNSARERWS